VPTLTIATSAQPLHRLDKDWTSPRRYDLDKLVYGAGSTQLPELAGMPGQYWAGEAWQPLALLRARR